MQQLKAPRCRASAAISAGAKREAWSRTTTSRGCGWPNRGCAALRPAATGAGHCIRLCGSVDRHRFFGGLPRQRNVQNCSTSNMRRTSCHVIVGCTQRRRFRFGLESAGEMGRTLQIHQSISRRDPGESETKCARAALLPRSGVVPVNHSRGLLLVFEHRCAPMAAQPTGP